MIRWLRDKTNLPIPRISVAPWWMWKIHYKYEPFVVFRNRPEVRNDGKHYRWGFRFIGFEFGNRG
jgi:hypothetical protein